MLRFPVLNIRKPKRDTQKSSDAIVDLLSSQTSRQYNKIGIHLTFKRCNTSSSEPTFKTLLRILLAARLNEALALLTENLSTLPATSYTPRYRISLTHQISDPKTVVMHLHSLLKRGPTRKAQHLETFKAMLHLIISLCTTSNIN